MRTEKINYVHLTKELLSKLAWTLPQPEQLSFLISVPYQDPLFHVKYGRGKCNCLLSHILRAWGKGLAVFREMISISQYLPCDQSLRGLKWLSPCQLIHRRQFAVHIPHFLIRTLLGPQKILFSSSSLLLCLDHSTQLYCPSFSSICLFNFECLKTFTVPQVRF